MNKYYIFGAHSRARTMAFYIKYLYLNADIEAFLVDDDENNEIVVDGIPVININLNSDLKFQYPVYIATRSISFEKVTKHLLALGFDDIKPVTVDLDLDIRNAFLVKYYRDCGMVFNKLSYTNKLDLYDTSILATVYVMTSAFDKPLKNNVSLKEYEEPMQVGSDLSDKRLKTISDKKIVYYDDDGCNISKKNEQFCELTGLYYLWKNQVDFTSGIYIGICHYRRHFILPNDWKQQVINNKIDAILPIPLYVTPSVKENYLFRHSEKEWNSMMKHLKNQNAADYEIAQSFFDKGIYCPCNMFIVRADILNDLCTFIFPILLEVAKECGKKDDPYQNRYPAFLAERLISLFFEKNKDKIKVAYVDKNFIE